MSLQIPIVGDLTGLQAALRNVPGIVGNAMTQASASGRAAFGGLFGSLRSSVTGFASFLSSSLVNAVAGVGIIQAFRGTVQKLDRVGDLSQRFGVSAESLQRLGGVAELSGSSMDAMAKAISKLGRTVVEAIDDPVGQAADKFNKLGISVDSLRGKSIEEVFGAVSQSISSLASETEQGAAAFDFFGRAGDEIRNVLQLGNDEFQKLSSGISVASDEAVSAAQNIDDAFKSLGQAFTSTAGGMLEAFRPAILFILDGFEQMSYLARIAMEGMKSVFTGQGLGSKGLEDATRAFANLNEAQTSRRLQAMTPQQLQQLIDSGDPRSSLRASAELSSRQMTAGSRTRSLGPSLSADQADVSLPQPERDKSSAILSRIEEILGSGRGIEPARIIADSLAQIGGGGNSVLVGRSDEEQKRLLQQQLSALQKIENNTREIDVATLR